MKYQDSFSIDNFIDTVLTSRQNKDIFWGVMGDSIIIGNASVMIKFDKSRLKKKSLSKLLQIFKKHRCPQPDTVIRVHNNGPALENERVKMFVNNIDNNKDDISVIKPTAFSLSNYKGTTVRVFATESKYFLLDNDFVNACIDYSRHKKLFYDEDDITDIFTNIYIHIAPCSSVVVFKSDNFRYKDITMYIAPNRKDSFDMWLMEHLPEPAVLFQHEQ